MLGGPEQPTITAWLRWPERNPRPSAALAGEGPSRRLHLPQPLPKQAHGAAGDDARGRVVSQLPLPGALRRRPGRPRLVNLHLPLLRLLHVLRLLRQLVVLCVLRMPRRLLRLQLLARDDGERRGDACCVALLPAGGVAGGALAAGHWGAASHQPPDQPVQVEGDGVERHARLLSLLRLLSPQRRAP